MFATNAKGVRYLEMAEGYILNIGVDEDNEVIGYKFVHLGKMMEFIRNAKARGERGEIKLVVDGFQAYMAQNEQQLRNKWEQQFLPNYLPPQEEERFREREYELDEQEYDERER
jgi:hypothetical protein